MKGHDSTSVPLKFTLAVRKWARTETANTEVLLQSKQHVDENKDGEQ